MYEKKLVTYPRTDARVLSTAVAKEITKNLNGITRGYKDEEVQGYIKKMVDEKYSTNLIKTKYVNDSKITDHYAIIPTGQGYENFNSLPELHKQVYKVITTRFLAIFYPPAEFNKIQATVEIEEENTKETFNASGKVCINQGYLEVLKPPTKSTTSEKTVESSVNNNKGFLGRFLWTSQEKMKAYLADKQVIGPLIFTLIQVIQVVIPIIPGGVSLLGGVIF